MVFAYLFRNLFLTIFLFFKHWYVGGFSVVYGKASGIIRNLEKNLAIKINMRFIFRPLYQEYNRYGYVMGFLFRSFRIIIGLLGYLIIMVIAFVLYAIWAAIPLFVIYKMVSGK